ncbi:acid protease [Hymenopellis radicata]|nr:acid protease [Hymenopellis radicata]
MVVSGASPYAYLRFARVSAPISQCSVLLLYIALACYTAASASPSPKQTVPRASASPSKIQLQSRKVPAGSSLRRRALGPANIPLDDFFKGTDLQWFGNISVGTPPQDITVVFDTGSSSLEFASTLCDSCSSQVQFDPTASSTFVDVGVDPVVGNNTQLQLRSAVDTVSVGGLTATDVDLFLITSQTPNFDIDPFSGIQGMGALAQGFFAGLIDQGLPSLFSLLLAPNDVGGAELTIGGSDESKFEGDLVFASNVGRSATWELDSPGIFQYQTQPDEPGTFGISCDLIDSLPAEIALTFTSENGTPFNLTIPSVELNVGPFANNASLCQTLINAEDDFQIVGASLLKHFYSVWDVGGQRMGFAPTLF